MRALTLHKTGLDGLKLEDIEPKAVGPHEVLVRVEHASLNYRDLVVCAGGYGSHIKLPLVPGSDGAGTVIAVGSAVRRFALGDRVMSCFFQGYLGGAPTREKLATTLGGPLDGMLREVACLHEDGLCALPAELDTRKAATLPCAAVTAWSALAIHDHVGPAHTVLVQGTGGVSLFALQLAKSLGARVIATSSDDHKLERLRQLGADHVIHYGRVPEWGKLARELSGGRGVDHVVEVGGAGTLAQSLRAIAPGACISLIGVLGGAKHEIHLPHVFMQGARLQGVVVGSREATEQLVRAVANARIEPVIDQASFRLEDTRAALEHLAARKHFGKVVIDLV